jgi:hypothetical protein
MDQFSNYQVAVFNTPPLAIKRLKQVFSHYKQQSYMQQLVKPIYNHMADINLINE